MINEKQVDGRTSLRDGRILDAPWRWFFQIAIDSFILLTGNAREGETASGKRGSSPFLKKSRLTVNSRENPAYIIV